MPEIELTKKQERELLAKGMFSSPFFTIVASVLATFLIAALFSKLGGEVPITVSSTTVQKERTFDVTAQATGQVLPDIATTNFGITVSSNTPASAQAQANQVLNNVKGTLKQLGVEEEDIKTTSYNINPDYSFDGGTPRITGYNVSSRIEVTFRNFETLNQAIDAAVEAGANLVGRLSFGLSDEARQSAEDEARQKAIGQAKKKAEKIAKTAGVQLGKVVNVLEETPQEPPIIRPLALEAEAEPGTEVSPGISEVRVRITLSFETK